MSHFVAQIINMCVSWHTNCFTHLFLSLHISEVAPGHFQINHSKCASQKLKVILWKFWGKLHVAYCLVFILWFLFNFCLVVLQPDQEPTRTEGQVCPGSTSLRVQRVRTGVLLVTIRTVRMMRGAGPWQVLVGTMTAGAPWAQVGPVWATSPIHLS